MVATSQNGSRLPFVDRFCLVLTHAGIIVHTHLPYFPPDSE